MITPLDLATLSRSSKSTTVDGSAVGRRPALTSPPARRKLEEEGTPV